MSLKQAQHILVTGAAGDIGSAIVAHFVGAGAIVTAVDIKSESEILDRYTQEQQSSIKAVCLDLCDQKAVSSLINTGAPLTGVIGNAGVGGTSAFVDIDAAFWQHTLDVNLTANFNLGQAAARHFIQHKTAGRIVFTGSWVGSVPWPEITSYTVSKAGLEMLAKQMARELAVHGIRVNVVAPGIVRAGLAGELLKTDPVYAKRAGRVVPLGQFQTADQVADVVGFLCSPAGDYITGTVLLADGGCSLFQFDSAMDENADQDI
jgi:NAD(P)-dependent dehydrogenase (short-subunit alcohol dehydrogenase family)